MRPGLTQTQAAALRKTTRAASSTNRRDAADARHGRRYEFVARARINWAGLTYKRRNRDRRILTTRDAHAKFEP